MQRAPKEVLLGDAPKEVLLGDAPKEVLLGDAALLPGYKKLTSIFVASRNSTTANIFFSIAPGVR